MLAEDVPERTGPTGPTGLPSVDRLLSSWRGMVEEVEEGYAWSRPEFINDCWCRGVLARAMPALPRRTQAGIRPRLDALDDRFRRATVPWPDREVNEGEAWWDHWVPRVLEPDAGERYVDGWPLGWDMLPFPRPETVRVRRHGEQE